MKRTTENKISFILLIILIIFVMIGKALPEYRKKFGSSDKSINYKLKNNIVGLNYNNCLEIILVINEEKISNIIFLDDNSYILYNKDIEGKDLKNGLETINRILYEKNLLKENKNYVDIISYNKKEKYVEIIKKELETNTKNIINITPLTLKEKINILNIGINDNIDDLKILESYSKEIIRKNKNNISKNIN